MLCYSVKSNSSTVTLLTQYVAGSMWRYGVRPSVSLSVPSFGRRTPLRQVAAVGPAGTQEISIDSGGCRAPMQHGAQQQMRAVSRCQLTQEAEHRLVYLGFEVGVWLLRSEFALGVRVYGSDYDRDRYPRGEANFLHSLLFGGNFDDQLASKCRRVRTVCRTTDRPPSRRSACRSL